MAAQQELGILSERGNQPNRIDIIDLVFDGTAIDEASRTSILAATICVFSEFDDLVLNEVVDEVVAGLNF